MKPELGLHYSSSSPLRGGVAAGWSLTLPSIERDTSGGAGVRYRSSTAPGAGRLMAANDGDSRDFGRYRGEFDDDFTRYFQSAGAPIQRQWSAFLSDGRVRTYSKSTSASDQATRWNIEKETDRFNNEIGYTWSRFQDADGYVDFLPERIEYTPNPGAGLLPHAKVEFVYAPVELCNGSSVPIGARTDHHFQKKRMFGAKRLTTIEVSVREEQGSAWRVARRVSLGYDTNALSCVQAGTPLRYLTQIDETAFAPDGTPSASPPINFTYGPRERTPNRQISLGNLGFGQHGNEDGLQGALMDVNGDRLVDRIWVETAATCVLHYQLGLPGGGFETQDHTRSLPSAAWGGDDPNVPTGKCSLNGQTNFRASTCALSPACVNHDVEVAYEFRDVDGDGRIDVIAQAWDTGTWLGGSFPGSRPTEPPTCPPPGPHTCRNVPLEPEQSSNPSGHPYLWRVVGLSSTVSGAIAAPEPLPLRSSMQHDVLPHLEDIDGDGLLDVLSLNRFPSSRSPLHPVLLPEATEIFVYRGTGHGFGPQEIWTKPAYDRVARGSANFSGSDGRKHSRNGTIGGFVDLNGDGLPDIIGQTNWTSPLPTHDGTNWTPPQLFVHWNQDGSFSERKFLGLDGPVTLQQSDYLEDSFRRAHGERGTLRQFTDVDADGLPDVFSMGANAQDVTSPPPNWTLHRNFGGAFSVGSNPSLGNWGLLKGIVKLAGRDWKRLNDFTDVTGDGLPDLIRWSDAGEATVFTDPVQAPMRLLTHVHNGRGSSLSFSYVPGTDVNVVEPGVGEYDRPRWVVRSVTVNPGADQPAMTAQYRYVGAAQGTQGPGDVSARHFLGFRKVIMEKPRQGGGGIGSRTIHEYKYDVGQDHRGQLEREWVYADPGNGALVPVSVSQHQYENLPILGGLASHTNRTLSVARTCVTGDNEQACEARTAARYSSEQLEPHTLPNGKIALYLPKFSLESQDAAFTHARRVVRDHDVSYGGSPFQYLVVEVRKETQKLDRVGNRTRVTPVARATTILNAQKLPQETQVWLSDSRVARTLRTFDGLGLGLVTTTQRPNVVADGRSEVAEQAYDSHKLFVSYVKNELGQEMFTKTDVATGAVIRKAGPAYRIIQLPGCADCSLRSHWAEGFVIDGFGRMREHWVSVDPTSQPAQGYSQLVVQTAEYLEGPNHIPNERITRNVGEWDGSRISQSTERLDGLGRVVQRSDTRGPKLAPAISRWTYDAIGEVATLEAPDPRVDTGALVTHSFTRDGLGRLTKQERPNGSWVETQYSGFDTTSQEFAPVEGSGQKTMLRRDAFGRLAEVHEYDNPQPGQIGVTRYEYDGLDRVERITDADNAITFLGHNWVGNRTSVTRAHVNGARTWTYTYDLEGNVLTSLSPLRAGDVEADYTTLNTYNVIGQLLTHTPATRGMSQEEQQRLAIGPTVNSYGSGEDTGRLVRVDLPFGSAEYAYDVHGQVRRETRTINVTASPANVHATQFIDREYTVQGQPRKVTLDNGTRWEYEYDVRGLLKSVAWADPAQGNATKVLASYERGLAGVPRNRTNSYGQHRVWHYDEMGRVEYDRVHLLANRLTRSERTYGYDGFGDLRLVSGTNDGINVDAQFTYDARHRVKHADGPHTYRGDFEYSASGNVKRATVSGALDTEDRDVDYAYGDVDPQAVDRLKSHANQQAIFELRYDESGNVTERSGNFGSSFMTWDGDDQLRAVSGDLGDEYYYYGPNHERWVALGDSVRFWFGVSETHFNWDGTQRVRYLHVAAGEPIARIENQSGLEFQYADALQSLMVSLDRSGTTVGAFTYGAFGELVSATGAESHRRQFNGKENDSASGLRYYGFRSYDPVTLRWASSDPLFRFLPDAAATDPQQANLFAFSLNNPLRYYDPDGRQPNAKPSATPSQEELRNKELQRKERCIREGLDCRDKELGPTLVVSRSEDRSERVVLSNTNELEAETRRVYQEREGWYEENLRGVYTSNLEREHKAVNAEIRGLLKRGGYSVGDFRVESNGAWAVSAENGDPSSLSVSFNYGPVGVTRETGPDAPEGMRAASGNINVIVGRGTVIVPHPLSGRLVRVKVMVTSTSISDLVPATPGEARLYDWLNRN